MKKGALHFLGRKNQSLFDTNIKIKDVENVELVLESSAIPESGTASVRARPTVKHHSSSLDSFQGFAVPTPKVPLLPHVNGPITNGSVNGDHLSNGSVISVPDLEEGEIFVPPPPSVAPPPPPGTFVPPPPDFMGDLNSLNLVNHQSPSMAVPKLSPFVEEEDLTFIKPPPMAPPNPPSSCSSGSVSSLSISSPSITNIPKHPTFDPPQPPPEMQLKTYKKPPPKPIRLSSMSSLDSPPETPAPAPPVHTPTLSTFNPQNAAKVYHVPQTSILSGYEEADTRPKQMLLLEDSASINCTPVLVQVDGKASKLATTSKPAPKDVQDPKQILQSTQSSQSLLHGQHKEANPGTVSTLPEIDQPVKNPEQMSLELQKLNSTEMNLYPINGKLEKSLSQSRTFSPMIDYKLRNLKNSETNGARAGPAASPLSLLMAAKERDRYKSSHSLPRENSKMNEQLSTSIHPSHSSPNSFIVTPRSSSSSSVTSLERIQESLKSINPGVNMQTLQPTAPVKDQSSTNFASTSATSLVEQKLNAAQSPSKSPSTQPEELGMPLLPPPPEFDDFDEIMEPPPMPPPDPPTKKAPTPVEMHISPSHVAPPPKPKSPAAPKLPPPDIDVKPKVQLQTKPKAPPAQLSPSQATLLSILQKKMLEIDHKMDPEKVATESTSDDWGTSSSEEENKVLAVHRATEQRKNTTVVNKPATLNMEELEGKVARKHQETSVRVPTSNGTQSKHQYGMTFTVRPGTSQPITLVRKEDP